MTKRRLTSIILIYCCMLFFIIFKMFYYEDEMKGFPDENMHIGYVIYLEQNPEKIIPDFRNMVQYSQLDTQGEYQYYKAGSNTINYLGHPPFYYHFMRIAADVQEENGIVSVNAWNMRLLNIFMTAISISILFYICFSRLIRISSSVLPHLVAAVSSVSVPMLSYVGAGVSNDNMVLLGMTLLLLGVLRYYEEKIGYGTYFLVGTGFLLSILAKLTAGEMAVVILFMVVITDLIRKKGFKIFLNRYFAATVVFYIIPIIYYLIIYRRYGGFQPSLQVLDYEYYKSTIFYVDESLRAHYTFGEYISYYWQNFVYTWVTLYGHNGWINKFISWVGWIGPCMIVVLAVAQVVRRQIKRNDESCFYLVFLCGCVVTMLTQFVSAYRTFLSVGYTGGYQARYYLCMIPFFAYCNGQLWCGDCIENKSKATDQGKRKKMIRAAVIVLTAVFILTMLYGDFVYYLLHREFTI